MTTSPWYAWRPPGARRWGPVPRPAWKRVLARLGVVILVLSLLLNAYLILLVSAGLFGREGLETVVRRKGRADQVIAVLKVGGVINAKQAAVADAFRRRVKEDPNVKAVVLRVVSGGGGIGASDRIYECMRDIKASGRRLVVSMGAVAASGGYYISAPADCIVAEPTTVTGSIGVIAAWPVWKGTLEKIGVKAVVIRSTKTRAWKAVPNPFEEPASYQLADVRRTLDELQERFERIVTEHRGEKLKPTAAVNTYKDAEGKEFTVKETEPFNGRVFLARRAVELGLVDKIGYLEDAIAEAGQLAGLSEPRVVVYRKVQTLREHLGFSVSRAPFDLEWLDPNPTPRLLMVWRAPS